MTEQRKQSEKQIQRLQFDRFVIDRSARTLTLHGEECTLPARGIDLLWILIDAQGDTCGKDALIERIWPDQDVSDASLSRLISDVRQVVGDTPAQQRLIQTIRNQGFRWNPGALPIPVVATQQAPPRARWPWLALGATLVAGAVFALRPNFKATDVGPIRAVVLPVDVATGDDQDAWAEYGVMSLLATELSRFSTLEVVDVQSTISSLSQIEYARDDSPATLFDNVCGSLGCTHLVDSRLVIEDGDTAIDYRIVSRNSVSDGARVSGGDILESADRAADQLVADLAPVRPERADVASMYTGNRVANQNLALAVNAALNRQYGNAEQYLNIALRETPDFAWANAYLADVYAHTDRADEALALLDSIDADDVAIKIFSLKIRSNIAHDSGDLQTAYAYAQSMEALGRDIDDPLAEGTALMNGGATLQSMGRNAEARKAYERAIALFTEHDYRLRFAQTAFNLGNVDYAEGDIDAAERSYRDASVAFRELGAEAYLSYVDYALCALSKFRGDYDAAVPCFEQVRDLSIQLGDREGALLADAELSGIALARGDAEAALGIAQKTYDESGEQYAYAKSYSSGMLALALLQTGQIDRAADIVAERARNEWFDPRPPYVFISANLAHARGDYEQAVALAEAVRDSQDDAWTDEHQKWLDAYISDRDSALPAIENYYTLENQDT
ncbi:MAG: winged helix-turn-helix domain-containing protein [Pseudomonadota bacterium]